MIHIPKPIENAADIELLVHSFYNKVLKDELLAPHFKDVDLPAHFPRMIQFWSFILLDEAGFTGNVFDKHIKLDIDKSHFDRWLKLFHETVNEYFTGPKADLANQRADLLGYTFSTKLEQMKKKEKRRSRTEEYK
jgi:hemoglobin